MILAIPGGGTYCVLFGGLAGGDEVVDTGQLWKVTNADGQGCPEPRTRDPLALRAPMR